MSESDSPRTPYNKNYYSRHRDSILEKKRSKYRDNQAYRESAMLDSRRRRAAKAVLTTMAEVDGKMVPAHRISEFAKMIGKSTATVNSWHRNGTIPASPFRTPGGFRLYTDAMASAVREVLAEISSPRKGDPDFCAAVTARWASAGIPVS